MTIVDALPSRCIEVCTAFSYEATPGAPAVFVSAGHCFDGPFRGRGHAVVLERLGDALKLNCTVAYLDFSELADDAILDCPGAVGVVGLRPAPPGRAVLSLPVAAAGFLLDGYSSHRITSSQYALVTLLARVGNAAGSLSECAAAGAESKATASCNSTRRSSPLQRGVAGFLDRAVAHGMSGGPVLDMQCRVVGITSAHTCGAGIFVGLSGVNTQVRLGA